jgi:hypothetical protein
MREAFNFFAEIRRRTVSALTPRYSAAASTERQVLGKVVMVASLPCSETAADKIREPSPQAFGGAGRVGVVSDQAHDGIAL